MTNRESEKTMTPTPDAAGPSAKEAVGRLAADLKWAEDGDQDQASVLTADLRLTLSTLAARDERIKGLEAEQITILGDEIKATQRANAAEAALAARDEQLTATFGQYMERAATVERAEAALASLRAELRAAVTVLESLGFMVTTDGSKSISTDLAGGEVLKRLSALHARLKTLTGVNTDG